MSWDQPLSTSETKTIVRNAVDNAVSGMSTAFDKKIMELATSQARAMQDLGEQIGENLYRIDDANKRRFLELTDGLVKFKRWVDMEFEETNQHISYVLDGIDSVSNQLNDIADRLDDIEFNTANPELVRANERYRSAKDLAKRGHFREALAQIDAAIENAGGAPLSHIPEFQVFKARLHLRDEEGVANPRQAVLSLDQAMRFTDQWSDNSRVQLTYLSALALLAANDLSGASVSYFACACQIQKCKTAPQGLDLSRLLYEGARCSLQGMSALAEIAKENQDIEAHVKKTHAQAEYALECALTMDWSLAGQVPTDPIMICHSDVVSRAMSNFWEPQLRRERKFIEEYLAWIDRDLSTQINEKLVAVEAILRPKGGGLPAKIGLLSKIDFKPEDDFVSELRGLIREDSKPLDFVYSRRSTKVRHISEKMSKTICECIDSNVRNLKRLIEKRDLEQRVRKITKYRDNENYIKRRSEELWEKAEKPKWPLRKDIVRPEGFFQRRARRQFDELERRDTEAWLERRAIYKRLEEQAREECNAFNMWVNQEFQDRIDAAQDVARDALDFLESLTPPRGKILGTLRTLPLEPERLLGS